VSRPEHSGNGYDRTVTVVATRALEVVTRAGVAHRVHAYDSPERHGRERDVRPSYGTDAAAALGVDASRILKTLVAAVDDGLVLAVVPVDRDLDPKRLADACGGRRAVLAEPAAAERATGYVIGGISPLGPRRALPVVIDALVLVHETVFVSAGRRGLQIELAPGDLVRLSGARSASITRDHPVHPRVTRG
jgi:Cys-tRNA(Pro)/Cys-tRNA(Cys) deacylase